MTTKGRLFLVLPLFLVLVFGCKKSSANVKVSGKVTKNQTTVVTGGTVMFHTPDGTMYTAPYTASEEALNARVPLDVARWHLHVNICLPPNGMAQRADWMKFGPAGSIANEQECTEAGGKFMPHLFGWMVHVYPFEQAPENIWPQ